MSTASTVINFLQSQRRPDQPAKPDAPTDPSERVLQAVNKASLLPVGDVVAATGLAAEDVLPIVEKLRGGQLLEVVKDGSDNLFLRLTLQGFRELART